MTKEIILSTGAITIVDDEDFDRFGHLRWQQSDKGYAHRVAYTPVKRHIRLHRAILDAPNHLVVDHINHDTLDNRRANLRLCTISENTHNSRRRAGGTSLFKGVHWDRDDKLWHATIRIDGQFTRIGRFKDEVEAARAFDVLAREVHGEFAYLNFPERQS